MRCLILILTIIMHAVPAFADGWAPMLTSHAYGPERMLAVDKASQTVVVLERHSPLREVLRFPCTTGQSLGDKLVEGDMRTPEGVYFVGGRIARKLDWDLYGNIAYSLNYPNPVDRIKGKTGSGIWIHGRGKTFVPRDTLGCVALKEPDMRDMSKNLEHGLPVIIADNLHWTREPGDNDGVAKELVEAVRGWAHDWQSKGDAFFEYYDPALMTLSEGSNFSRFVDHKKRVFRNNPWIHVMVDNIHVVQGPDYWVTWFDQFYRTGGMASTTGKRFYWMRDPDGKWRIVGREYTTPKEKLDSAYLAAKSLEVRKVLERWRSSWLAMDADSYEDVYAADAVQGKRKGASSIVDYKRALWAEKPPVKVEIDGLKVATDPQGLRVAFLQTFADAGGYADRGRKTMVLTPSGDTWKIRSEQWSRVQ